jgi:hypothetical protein
LRRTTRIGRIPRFIDALTSGRIHLARAGNRSRWNALQCSALRLLKITVPVFAISRITFRLRRLVREAGG